MRTIPDSLIVLIFVTIGSFVVVELQLFCARKLFERLPTHIREKYTPRLIQIHKRQTMVERFFLAFLAGLLAVTFFGPDWLFRPIAETLK